MEYVRIDEKDAVASVWMNRAPVNALSPVFLLELEEAANQLAENSDVRVVVFRSEIRNIFVGGADVNYFHNVGRRELGGTMERFRATFDAIEAIPKPTVAAVSGIALGGGCELTLACDFRVMVDDEKASIGQTEIVLGMIPGGGATQRLPRLVGQGRALDLILTGRRVRPAEAREIGLVTTIHPPERFDAEVAAFAATLAALPPYCAAQAKRLIRRSFEVPLAEGLGDEIAEFIDSTLTDDGQEGLNAFFEKRRPTYAPPAPSLGLPGPADGR